MLSWIWSSSSQLCIVIHPMVEEEGRVCQTETGNFTKRKTLQSHPQHLHHQIISETYPSVSMIISNIHGNFILASTCNIDVFSVQCTPTFPLQVSITEWKKGNFQIWKVDQEFLFKGGLSQYWIWDCHDSYFIEYSIIIFITSLIMMSFEIIEYDFRHL